MTHSSQYKSQYQSQYQSKADQDQSSLHRMIRVDHAGEFGAVRIYQGQLDALKNSGAQNLDLIQHMKDQEVVHYETFNKIINAHKVRPTALSPLWHAAGYAMGYLTAKMGEKAAMACTVAVETVIDEHYAKQEQQLEKDGTHPELLETVKCFRQEELEHRDLGLEHGAEQAPGYELIKKGIMAASKAAIFLSKRI